MFRASTPDRQDDRHHRHDAPPAITHQLLYRRGSPYVCGVTPGAVAMPPDASRLGLARRRREFRLDESTTAEFGQRGDITECWRFR